MGGEFRYLNNTYQGKLSGEYLPSDNNFDDKDRYLVGFEHYGKPMPRLETTIRASKVSDDFYFRRFRHQPGRNQPDQPGAYCYVRTITAVAGTWA